MKSTPKVSALLNQINSGKLESDKAKILNLIIGNEGADIVNMEYKLKMKIQTLTARLSDLEDIGIIYKKGSRDRNGTDYSCFYYEWDSAKQRLNANKREQDKFMKWCKVGTCRFTHMMNDEMITFLNDQ